MQPLIGQILTELGLVNEWQIAKAMATQRSEGHKRRLGEILAQEVGLTDEALTQALSRQFSMPLMTEDMAPEALPIDKVSFDFLKANNILPLSKDATTMSIAIADPTDLDAADSLKASFDCDIKIFLAPHGTIQRHIAQLQASKDAVMQRLLEGVTEQEADAADTGGEVSHLKDLAQEKGIIQLASLIIENAVKEGASDVHVEPEETYVRVRYRIDGLLYDREVLPVKTQAALSSRLKLLANMNIAERRLPQDGRIRGHFAGKDVDIRVSTLPTVYGESIVMRILDRETAFISLEELGFDRLFLDKYEELIRKPYGMLLITGPTGSGKTTTLYASLDRINSPEKKIITIEEPVEYLLKGINQIQVRTKIGLTFSSGLRHIVRQDPDIIMVGEVRDLETASIAIHAALTGHLLFSTLHTNDAPSAATRLVDMGAEHYLVASTLIGVVAQRLVRKICPSCKEPYTPQADTVSVFGKKVDTLWRGKGCESCMGTGYRGRMAIFELMSLEDPLRDLIMSKASSRQIKEKTISLGMRSLREDGLNKALSGITTVDEVLRVTQSEI